MAKAGATETLTVTFTDTAGALKTGLSPTLTIRCIGGTNDTKYLQADASWGASKADLSMTEVDATNSPGDYEYDFALPSDEYDGVSYYIVADGTASASPRYATAEVEATSDDIDDLQYVIAVAKNKMTLDVDPESATYGRVTIYESDGTTVLRQFDSTSNSGVITRTPV